MIWEKEFVKLIKNEFQKKKLRNPRFSARQYAKKLDLSIGALSEVLNGKRSLTHKRALKVIANLDADPEEKERIYMLMGQKVPGDNGGYDFVTPIEELQKIIGDWRNFAILAILFHPDAEDILPKLAHSIGISEEDARARLALLQTKLATDTDYIRFHLDALQENRRIFTGESLRNFQANQIELLKLASQKSTGDQGLFYGFAMYTSAEQYRSVLEEVRGMLLKLVALAPQEPREKLFQISLQMFPLEIS